MNFASTDRLRLLLTRTKGASRVSLFPSHSLLLFSSTCYLLRSFTGSANSLGAAADLLHGTLQCVLLDVLTLTALSASSGIQHRTIKELKTVLQADPHSLIDAYRLDAVFVPFLKWRSQKKFSAVTRFWDLKQRVPHKNTHAVSDLGDSFSSDFALVRQEIEQLLTQDFATDAFVPRTLLGLQHCPRQLEGGGEQKWITSLDDLPLLLRPVSVRTCDSLRVLFCFEANITLTEGIPPLSAIAILVRGRPTVFIDVCAFHGDLGILHDYLYAHLNGVSIDCVAFAYLHSGRRFQTHVAPSSLLEAPWLAFLENTFCPTAVESSQIVLHPIVTVVLSTDDFSACGVSLRPISVTSPLHNLFWDPLAKSMSDYFFRPFNGTTTNASLSCSTLPWAPQHRLDDTGMSNLWKRSLLQYFHDEYRWSFNFESSGSDMRNRWIPNSTLQNLLLIAEEKVLDPVTIREVLLDWHTHNYRSLRALGGLHESPKLKVLCSPFSLKVFDKLSRHVYELLCCEFVGGGPMDRQRATFRQKLALRNHIKRIGSHDSVTSSPLVSASHDDNPEGLVDTEVKLQQVQRFVRAICSKHSSTAGQLVVGVDIEFDGVEYFAHETACLIQLSFARLSSNLMAPIPLVPSPQSYGLDALLQHSHPCKNSEVFHVERFGTFVFDCLSLPPDQLKSFLALLFHDVSSAALTPIFHAAPNDLRILKREFQIVPLRYIDTAQVEAKLYSLEQGKPTASFQCTLTEYHASLRSSRRAENPLNTGLGTLMEEYLGIRKDKLVKFSCWVSQRPLSTAALEYAATDAFVLPALLCLQLRKHMSFTGSTSTPFHVGQYVGQFAMQSMGKGTGVQPCDGHVLPSLGGLHRSVVTASLDDPLNAVELNDRELVERCCLAFLSWRQNIARKENLGEHLVMPFGWFSEIAVRSLRSSASRDETVDNLLREVELLVGHERVESFLQLRQRLLRCWSTQ